MKAYELGADGQAKEIEIPKEGREYLDKTRERLVELVAESDDALMEKYFAQGTLDEADILPNINKAIANSKLSNEFHPANGYGHPASWTSKELCSKRSNSPNASTATSPSMN